MGNITKEERERRANQVAVSGDERMVRSVDEDMRGDVGHMEDSARKDPFELSAYEKLLDNEFEQSALPTPPEIPGYHLCWLTTQSKFDTIHKRQRIGYEPVTRAEMRGFDPDNGQILENFSDYVTCNEMVLFKIRLEQYDAIMNLFHHRKPLESEESILTEIESRMGAKDALGRDVGGEEGDGHSMIKQQVSQAKRMRPTFI